jgi:hypothetical protein
MDHEKQTPPPDCINEAIGTLMRRGVEAGLLDRLAPAMGAEFGKARVLEGAPFCVFRCRTED